MFDRGIIRGAYEKRGCIGVGDEAEGGCGEGEIGPCGGEQLCRRAIGVDAEDDREGCTLAIVAAEAAGRRQRQIGGKIGHQDSRRVWEPIVGIRWQGGDRRAVGDGDTGIAGKGFVLDDATGVSGTEPNGRECFVRMNGAEKTEKKKESGGADLHRKLFYENGADRDG